jgi:phage terminase small subunit
MRPKLFAQEYVIDFNGRRAAIAAGYSEARAEVTASELLKVPRVMAMINKLQSQRATKLGLKAEQVLEELQKIAFSNILDYMVPGEAGALRLDLSKLTRYQAAAVAEIRTYTSGGSGDGERQLVVRTRFKLVDKLGALDKLMRHLGLYNDKVQVSGDEDLISLSSQEGGDCVHHTLLILLLLLLS